MDTEYKNHAYARLLAVYIGHVFVGWAVCFSQKWITHGLNLSISFSLSHCLSFSSVFGFSHFHPLASCSPWIHIGWQTKRQTNATLKEWRSHRGYLLKQMSDTTFIYFTVILFPIVDVSPSPSLARSLLCFLSDSRPFISNCEPDDFVWFRNARHYLHWNNAFFSLSLAHCVWFIR